MKVNKKISTYTVDVGVYDFKCKVMHEAKVNIKNVKKRERSIDVEFYEKLGFFRAENLKSGHYIISVVAHDYSSDERTVHISSNIKEIFMLGKEGMPSYYRGIIKVPFDPPTDLVAFSAKGDLSNKDWEELRKYAESLRLEYIEVDEQIIRNNVRVFRFPRDIDIDDKEKIKERLSEHSRIEFVGPVIKLDENASSFLTRDVIVKFMHKVTEKEVNDLLHRFDLELIRQIPYIGNGFQARYKKQASFKLLDLCDELVKTGLVEYAEPDLFSTLVEDQINPTDYLFPEQYHHGLINTPQAWQLLANNDPTCTYGNPNIIITVVDSGVDAALSDFNGNLSNGDLKIYELFDFANMVPNNNILASNHGSGCAGGATAQADNQSPIATINEGVVGVAGNCKLIGVRGWGPESRYSDAFIWMAGFDPNSTTANFPNRIDPGADVISCSFGYSGGAPISGLMKDTFDYLTTYGRDGKGVVLFFSVGNFIPPRDYTLERPWAAYEKTFAIAASTLANDGVTEEISTYSGFGGVGVLDLCAPSHDEYIGDGKFHNPPQNYGAITCDISGDGNLPGHPVTQTQLTLGIATTAFTTITANALPGNTTLNVANNAGFAVNQWVQIGLHGGLEIVQITAIPAGTTQLRVTPLLAFYRAGSMVTGASTINVNSNAGFLVNSWLLLEQPGQVNTEALFIRNLIGNNQIEIFGPYHNHNINTPVITGQNNYRNDFGGTSFSTPVCAGVAAIVLSGNPDLTWIQIRNILRTTAEQIDIANADPIGQWMDIDGDGVVDYSRWYGYGRVDAEAAVQAAIDLIGVQPLQGIDTWIRENENDIGDVPSLPPYSPDVWVRNQDPTTDNPANVNQHQSPIRGQDNWIYVNIRNRGTINSHDVYVRIFITRWAGTQYVYPDDFIPTTNPGQTPTQPLQPGTYLIGEIHIGTILANDLVTIDVKWPAELVPPASVTVDGVVYSWADACLLVDVSPHDGPPHTGNNTWDNNNLCQKNVFPLDPGAGDDAAIAFVVGNRRNYAEKLNLRIERKHLPAEVKLYVDYVNDDVANKVIDYLRIFKERKLRLPSKVKKYPWCKPFKTRMYQMHPEKLKNRTIFALPTIRDINVPIIKGKGEYQMVALILRGLKDLKEGKYEIYIYQENISGTIEGAINFNIEKRG